MFISMVLKSINVKSLLMKVFGQTACLFVIEKHEGFDAIWSNIVNSENISCTTK